MINFDQDEQLLHAGVNVTVSSAIGGNYDFATNLGNPRSGNWDAGQDAHLTLGPAQVGGYGLSVSEPDAGFYFYSWITILPNGGQLILQHFENKPPAPLEHQPFADNILMKYLHGLNGDYLLTGLRNAVAALPGQAAGVGIDTFVLATVFFPEATVPFLVGSAAGLAVDFFAKINDCTIEAMVDDGALTGPEGTFLKFAFGMPAVVSGANSLITDEAALERADDALSLYDTVHDLQSAGGEMDYKLRFKTTDNTAPTAAVVIHINHLPQ
jgi:hypothetical protein